LIPSPSSIAARHADVHHVCNSGVSAQKENVAQPFVKSRGGKPREPMPTVGVSPIFFRGSRLAPWVVIDSRYLPLCSFPWWKWRVRKPEQHLRWVTEDRSQKHSRPFNQFKPAQTVLQMQVRRATVIFVSLQMNRPGDWLVIPGHRAGLRYASGELEVVSHHNFPSYTLLEENLIVERSLYLMVLIKSRSLLIERRVAHLSPCL
jgi:hypothetical protein